MSQALTPQQITAYQNAFACAVASWKPETTFYNTTQTYGLMCPDGLMFFYTVAAGLFPATSQAEANAIALSYAEAQAGKHAICISGVNPNATVGVFYDSVIQATGESLAQYPATDVWSLVAGAVPPGLTLANGGFINGQAKLTGGLCPLSGTPTVAGNYSFTLRVTDPVQDSMQKTFNISVAI